MEATDEMMAIARRIAKLNAPDQGMRYIGGHHGERRYDEMTGKPYITRSQPSSLTIYGERAETVMAIIKHCEAIADHLKGPDNAQ